MNKLCFKYWIFILSLFFVFDQNIFAQMSKVERAQDCYQAKDLNGARSAIDSAFSNKEVRADAFAWRLRAYIYKEFFAKTDIYKLNSAFRDSSIKYLNKSMSLAASPDNKKLMEYHSIKYHVLCKSLLNDSINYNNSVIAYNRYKELYKKVDSSFNFKAKDIEYYLAAGSFFHDRYNTRDSTRTEYLDIAKACFQKVLDLDPKNISANFNLGIIYYNQGAKLFRQMELDASLEQLEVYQDNAVKLFKQSLPFMNKVYELDPNRKDAIYGLEGIYEGLNDTNKSKEFKKKLDALNQKK